MTATASGTTVHILLEGWCQIVSLNSMLIFLILQVMKSHYRFSNKRETIKYGFYGLHQHSAQAGSGREWGERKGPPEKARDGPQRPDWPWAVAGGTVRRGEEFR